MPESDALKLPSAKEAVTITIIGELQIAKLRLARGDVLVVKIDRTVDSDLANRIYASMKPHLPDGVRLLVIDPAIELSVLTRADIEAKAA